MLQASVNGVRLDDPRATEGRLARLLRDELIERRTSKAGRELWRLTVKGRQLLQTEGDPEIVALDGGSGVKRDIARRRKGKGKTRTVKPVAILTDHAIQTLDYWRRHNAATLFAYFVQEADGGAIKIGEAVNPVKRLEHMQCGNPRELRIEAVILAGRSTEWQLHGYWRASASIRGEWFGKGQQEAILAKAIQIADAQIEAHKERVSLEDIRDKVFIRELFRESECPAAVV